MRDISGGTFEMLDIHAPMLRDVIHMSNRVSQEFSNCASWTFTDVS